MYLSIPFHEYSEEMQESEGESEGDEEEDGDLTASRDGSVKYMLYCISFIPLTTRESNEISINEKEQTSREENWIFERVSIQSIALYLMQ